MQSGEAFGVMGAPRASQPFEVGGQLTATMEWPTLTQHRHQRVNVSWAGKRHLRLPVREEGHCPIHHLRTRGRETLLLMHIRRQVEEHHRLDLLIAIVPRPQAEPVVEADPPLARPWALSSDEIVPSVLVPGPE